jgi:hypothetical protein
MVFNIVLFPPTAYSVSYFACPPPLPPQKTKHFLVTDIININTKFRARNTYDMAQTTTHSKKTHHIAINGYTIHLNSNQGGPGSSVGIVIG